MEVIKRAAQYAVIACGTQWRKSLSHRLGLCYETQGRCQYLKCQVGRSEEDRKGVLNEEKNTGRQTVSVTTNERKQ